MTIELTDANFEEKVLKAELLVLIDLWAEWCGPCRMVKPVVEQLSEEYEGKIIVGEVDVDANPNVTVDYGVRNIPTLLFFKNGELVDKQVGAVPKAVLAEKIDALL